MPKDRSSPRLQHSYGAGHGGKEATERCETCHGTATFTMPGFVHKGMDDFFGGSHGKLACQACHTRQTGAFPAGQGTVVRYRIERTCASCHTGF